MYDIVLPITLSISDTPCVALHLGHFMGTVNVSKYAIHGVCGCEFECPLELEGLLMNLQTETQ